MTLIQSHSYPCRERPSITLFVTSSVAPPGSSLLPKLEIFEQPNRLLGPKFPIATTNVSKYSVDDL